MTPEDLIAYFHGVSATAEAFGISPPSVSEWKSNGRVPVGRQYQAEVLTRGRLRADRADKRPAQTDGR